MKLIIALIAITAAEHIAQSFITDAETWYFALGAKYLSLALALNCLLLETRNKNLLHRSVVALACIWAWIDFAEHCLWQFSGFDASLIILVLWSLWLVFSLKREYNHQGDQVKGGNVFIMLLRPTTALAVCKALVGFPCASVCLYANGTVWSFRGKTGTFDLYPVDARWLNRHIAIDTGVHCSDTITEMLDDLVGQRRWPGTKCVWVIRKALKRLGYAPRWCDYVPGIFAHRLLRGRG